MAKAIMVQGTMSDAGKSLLTCGLCRIFAQDGYRVAPFKSQNMALNSYITKNGLEMGRAQVTQAEAAKKEPDVRMNPILLKPSSNDGSQVIVNGVHVDNMKAQKYFKLKETLLPEVKKAYQSLADENDIIVIEGAGSPAEINLRQNDFVNMGMAKLAKAPVLLAGDIDRGGVFAQLYGTVELVTPEERSYIKGLVINKFRGDVTLLNPGLTMLENLVHIPILGVVPYLDVDIDEEDSLGGRAAQKGGGQIDICIVRFPHISNFTDFTPLEHIPGASVRYVASQGAWGNPDLVILPGTKNTLGDLAWLRRRGLDKNILCHARAGKPVFGICGGYQMLTGHVSDPEGAEQGGSLAGLCLLPARTVFHSEKTRAQVRGIFGEVGGVFAVLSGKAFSGYEIHMGQTLPEGGSPLAVLTDGSGEKKADGLWAGNVYGSYVHGLFDSPQVLTAISQGLLAQKGMAGQDESVVFDAAAYKESQYDLLAQGLRESLNINAVYNILEQGILS